MKKNLNHSKCFDVFNSNPKEELKESFLNPFGYNFESSRNNIKDYDYECLKTKTYDSSCRFSKIKK